MESILIYFSTKEFFDWVIYCNLVIIILICRATGINTTAYEYSSKLKSQEDGPSTSENLSKYLPPDIDSQYMSPAFSATLPRRLPSQLISTMDTSFQPNKYPKISPASHRKSIAESENSMAKTELFLPKDRIQASSVRNHSTTSETSNEKTTPSPYPSALSSSSRTKYPNINDGVLNKPIITVSPSPSYSTRAPSSSTILSKDEHRYYSLPRSSTYRSSTSGYSTPSASSSTYRSSTSGYSTPSTGYSSTSYNSHQPERASSIQPNYKRISPHSFSSYYTPKATSGMPMLEESKNRRKYISKSEALSARPSTRPW